MTTCRWCGCDGADKGGYHDGFGKCISLLMRERDAAEAKALAAIDQRDAVEAAARVFLTEHGVRCNQNTACDGLATQKMVSRGRQGTVGSHRCDKCPPVDGETALVLPQAALVRLLGVES